MQGPASEASVRQFLSFMIDGEECALDLSHVREIVRYASATRVPRVPAGVRGVVNLRGDVLPVIDMAVGLGLPEARVTAQSCLLVVEVELGGERSVVGLLADSVHQVLEIRPEDVQPPPPFGTRVPADLALGMVRLDGRFVLILDLDRVLAGRAFLHGVEAVGPASPPKAHGGAAS